MFINSNEKCLQSFLKFFLKFSLKLLYKGKLKTTRTDDCKKRECKIFDLSCMQVEARTFSSNFPKWEDGSSLWTPEWAPNGKCVWATPVKQRVRPKKVHLKITKKCFTLLFEIPALRLITFVRLTLATYGTFLRTFLGGGGSSFQLRITCSLKVGHCSDSTSTEFSLMVWNSHKSARVTFGL